MTIDVYLLNTSFVIDKYDYVLSIIDDSRKEKAFRYVKENDRLLSLGAAYLMKKYLPKGNIIENKNGKPYLEGGPFFNISHSGEYIVLSIHNTREVGIDIQQINKDKLNGIKYVLCDNEKDVTNPETLFQIWSNKESLIKCISTSLKDIRTISGLPLGGIHKIDNEDYFTKSMIYKGYSLSLSLKGEDSFEINIKQANI